MRILILMLIPFSAFSQDWGRYQNQWKPPVSFQSMPDYRPSNHQVTFDQQFTERQMLEIQNRMRLKAPLSVLLREPPSVPGLKK